MDTSKQDIDDTTASSDSELTAKYRGVNGWLLLLCVYLVILRPTLAVFGTLITNYTNTGELTLISSLAYSPISGMQAYFLMSFLTNIAMLVFGIAAGLKLWSIRPNAVKFVKLFFAALVALGAISIALPYMTDLPKNVADNIFEMNAVTFFISLIIAIIWITYLNKSKRVKATYSHG